MDRQPHLVGRLLELRPLRPDDFDALFRVASDPLIWEQHPERNRYQEGVFRGFFDEALASGGALVALDRATGRVIGSSRFHGYDPKRSVVEIGWTFLARAYWGGRYNGEMKRLMLEHAFGSVERVIFVIGPDNRRSRRAVEKIGGVLAGTTKNAHGRERVMYELTPALYARQEGTGNEPQVHEGYFPVPSAQLYFRAVGAGAPLVILHGGPDFNHSYLLPELDRLSSAFRLVYYDQRGRGKSSRGVAPEDVTIESEVEDLDRLRRYLGLDSLAVLGHSWGGNLAMEYATRHPDRASRLILMNTGPACHADLLRVREARQATEASSLERMRAIAGTPEYANGSIEAEAEYYRVHFGAAFRRPEQLESVVGRLRAHFTPEAILKARAIEERLYAQTWLSPDYDLLPVLRQLKTPTLVIHGERDLIPLECARNVAEAVPGARLVVLRDCGHFAYLERPAEVLGAIVGFLPRDGERLSFGQPVS